MCVYMCVWGKISSSMRHLTHIYNIYIDSTTGKISTNFVKYSQRNNIWNIILWEYIYAYNVEAYGSYVLCFIFNPSIAFTPTIPIMHALSTTYSTIFSSGAAIIVWQVNIEWRHIALLDKVGSGDGGGGNVVYIFYINIC